MKTEGVSEKTWMDSIFCTALPAESATRTVNPVKGCGTVGVPTTRPSEVTERPGGILPVVADALTTDQVYGGTPPAASKTIGVMVTFAETQGRVEFVVMDRFCPRTAEAHQKRAKDARRMVLLHFMDGLGASAWHHLRRACSRKGQPCDSTAGAAACQTWKNFSDPARKGLESGPPHPSPRPPQQERGAERQKPKRRRLRDRCNCQHAAFRQKGPFISRVGETQ
jgi:hypothetical protein